jgi:hypothetical protein
MEKSIGEDFEKIVFLPDNKPFLLAKEKNKTLLSGKYPDFYFLEETDRLLARPPAPKPPARFGSKSGKPFVKRGFGGGGKPPYKKFDANAPKPKPVLNPLYKRFKSN